MLLAIAFLAGLLVLNALFAMSELAMMTSRQSRLQQSAAQGSRGAAAALALAREPTRFLSTVQVGMTLVSILAGAFGEKAISTRMQQWVARIPALEPYSDIIALIIVVALIAYFSLVFGELVPKRLALAHPEAIASAISRPLNLLAAAAAAPVSVLMLSTDAVLKALRIKPPEGDDVSEEDVRSLVARAATTGVFTPLEHALFKRMFRVGDLTVRDLMVPRSEIVWIDEGRPIEEVRMLVATNAYSHFPVCRGSLDQVSGVVHIKELIARGLLAAREFNVPDAARRPLFVPGAMPALNLLDIFKSTRTHVALVVDEHGRTQGLITLNDVVSSLVGDISRRGQKRAPAATRRDDGSWLIDGRMPLHEMIAALGMTQGTDMPDVRTTAGLVTAVLGHVPREGEYAQWQGYRFEVVDMDGARVDKVLARAQQPPAA
jgi:putative hemolysin